MTDVGRATRLALALYPDRWREEYANPIVSTLLDVAEAQGRERPELVEVAGLAVRGGWLRARTSPVFWGGLLLVLIVLGSSHGFGSWWFGVPTERYWTAAISNLGPVLPGELSMVATLAVLQGWRRGRRGMTRPRLRSMVLDLLPIVAWCVVGALLALGFWIAAGGWPVPTGLDVRYVVAFGSLALGTASAGYALGRAVPLGPAVVIVAVCSVVWWWSAWGTANFAWRNLTGFNFVNYTADMYGNAPRTAFIASTVIGLLCLVLGVLVVASERPLRVLCVVVAGVVIVGVFARGPALDWVGRHLYEQRDAANLECRDDICLWPEQEALGGPLIRQTLAGSIAAGEEIGLPAPHAVTAGPSRTGQVAIAGPADPTRQEVIAGYANGYVDYTGCANDGYSSVEYDDDRMSALLALTLVFGGEIRHDSPVEYSIETTTGSRTLSAAQLRERFGVHDLAQARTIARAWIARGPEC